MRPGEKERIAGALRQRQQPFGEVARRSHLPADVMKGAQRRHDEQQRRAVAQLAAELPYPGEGPLDLGRTKPSVTESDAARR